MTSPERYDPPPTAAESLFVPLIRDRWRIAMTVLLALAFGAAAALLLKPTYTATALILLPRSQPSETSVMVALGSIASFGNSGVIPALKNPSALYIGLLRSNVIADRLIQRFHLRHVYGSRTMDGTRATLEKHAQFTSQQNGIICIHVTDHDPRRASALANGFIEELYWMNSTLALHEATQRHKFFTQQVVQERRDLDKAEDALVAVQMKTGVVQLGGQSGQIEVVLHTIAQVRVQIIVDQTELQGLMASSTQQNPVVQRLRREIAALRTELKNLQDHRGCLQSGSALISTGCMPQAELEYTRKLRNVQLHEALFRALLRAGEAAGVDEARSAPIIQTVNRAAPPDQRSGPPRLRIVLGAGLAGLLLACLWSWCRAQYRQARAEWEYRESLQRVRATAMNNRDAASLKTPQGIPITMKQRTRAKGL